MSEIGKPLKEWQIDEPQLIPARPNPEKYEDQPEIPQETEKELEKRVEEVEVGG